MTVATKISPLKIKNCTNQNARVSYFYDKNFVKKDFQQEHTIQIPDNLAFFYVTITTFAFKKRGSLATQSFFVDARPFSQHKNATFRIGLHQEFCAGSRDKISMPITTDDGKPIIRMFSSTSCPHCTWAKQPFDDTMMEYADQVQAYHWELDIGDNTLTDIVESDTPKDEMMVYRRFNPSGTVPTFVFGCKYFRIGSGFERAPNGKAREAEEFREIIEKLLKETSMTESIG